MEAKLILLIMGFILYVFYKISRATKKQEDIRTRQMAKELGSKGEMEFPSEGKEVESKPRVDSDSYQYKLEFSEIKDDQQEISARGFVVCLYSDNQRLSWAPIPRSELEEFQVAGVSYRKDALQDKSFAPGEVLSLLLEPGNPYDDFAVAVCNRNRTLHVGYIPRQHSARISHIIAKGEKYRCLSLWERTKGDERVALRILLVRGDTRVEGT